MRPCVTGVYQKIRIKIVVCDKLQNKVGLLSTVLCDSCIAGKSQKFFNLWDDKLYSIVNGFDKYIWIVIHSWVA